MADHEKKSIELMIKANKLKLDDILIRGENQRAEQLQQQIVILSEIRDKVK